MTFYYHVNGNKSEQIRICGRVRNIWFCGNNPMEKANPMMDLWVRRMNMIEKDNETRVKE